MAVNFEDKTASAIRALDAKAGAIIRAVADVCVEAAKHNIDSTLNNTGASTGELKESVKHSVRGTGLGTVARVGTPKVHGRIHEYGGVIQAKDAPYLVFKTADGEWHSVETVNMPARPWLRPAVLSARGQMQTAANAAARG